MLNIYKLVLTLSLFQVSYCCQGRLYEKKTLSEIDYTTKYIYTWLVVIYDRHNESQFGISYASIIHPKAVLTTAAHMEGQNAEALTVRTDCDVPIKEYFVNCTSRDVMKIIYPDDYDDQPAPENTYALLLLQAPFEITPTVKPISLANSMEFQYTETCMVFHWLRLYDETHDRYGVVAEAYHLPYVNGEFNFNAMNEEQLRTSRDFIIDEDYLYEYFIEGDRLPVNFFGSPLVCLHKNDYPTSISVPFQVGIATFSVVVPFAEKKPLKFEGSLFLTTDYYDEIMRKLKENFI